MGGWRGCGWVLIRALLSFFNFIIYKTVFVVVVQRKRKEE